MAAYWFVNEFKQLSFRRT